jgi:hypothetical protein
MDKRQSLWVVLKINCTSTEQKTYSYRNYSTFYLYDVGNQNYEYGRITI